MHKISFVYFDVGGVAIKDFSDTSKWDKMIDNQLGIPPKHRNDFNSFYDSIEPEICTGNIHVDSLLPKIIKEFHATVDPSFSLQKYFVEHFSKNISIIEVMQSLVKRDIKIGLLTDQYPGLLDAIFEKGLLDKSIFDVIIDSSIEKVHKPDKAIYILAATKAKNNPENILFIDNTKANIDAASTLGWQTFLYDSSDYDQANKDLAEFISQNL
jgi:HAD superfamily hydrolase (TIGR01509 family)